MLKRRFMRNLASQGLENPKKIFYHLNLHIIIIEFILASIVLFFTPKNHPRIYPGFYRTIFTPKNHPRVHPGIYHSIFAVLISS